MKNYIFSLLTIVFSIVSCTNNSDKNAEISDIFKDTIFENPIENHDIQCNENEISINANISGIIYYPFGEIENIEDIVVKIQQKVDLEISTIDDFAEDDFTEDDYSEYITLYGKKITINYKNSQINFMKPADIGLTKYYGSCIVTGFIEDPEINLINNIRIGISIENFLKNLGIILDENCILDEDFTIEIKDYQSLFQTYLFKNNQLVRIEMKILN